MTFSLERERQYYWRFAKQLSAARVSGDDDLAADAIAELEGIALHCEDAQLRRLARSAVDAARQPTGATCLA